MSDSEWIKVEFQTFINEYGKEIVVENAPIILYSKKDKEHEAYASLVAFFFIAGFLLIYIAVSYFLSFIFFNLVFFIVIIIVLTISDVFLIINIIKSNVYIKPLECWVEIFKRKSESNSDLYCFAYFPVFSGKCHPNEVMNVLLKLYYEQVIKSKIDITQIEVYLKLSKEEPIIKERIGFFFQYAEGRTFKDENAFQNPWKYFPNERQGIDNYLVAGNWEHQYEWRNDLEFDFDKLHEYAPWVIQRWNDINLKPLSEEYKDKINWNLRNIVSTPKLKPWEGNLENQSYTNPLGNKDIEIVNTALTKIIGKEKEVEKLKDVKDEIGLFETYFRDLTP
ncbi:MAG: hypothetical protein ACFFDF_06465 [Candidatus Odinarchaeota archaeon]